jgi:hypothetical protein
MPEKPQTPLEYALSIWPDTRQELITREAAAQIVEQTLREVVPMLPVTFSEGELDGVELACDCATMALRFKDWTI